ncbi:MAG: polyamine ABC transporter ATP-binding protein [Actinobacteria bacterium]|nr:polyamine ABC transporter ATP-binding protein [Actinomycetota bacterium]
MDTGDSVVQLDKVRKQYGSFVAVHEADFSIGRGEFFAMLGPSGCGKTTTLKMIAGFEEPTSGRILLEGEDVSDVPPHKRNVNTVFQQYALFPHMSVFDNIAFGPRSKKLSDTEVTRRVREMLDVVRLGDFASRRPAQLSGGQQQRVALARALVNYPSALLLDEPLAALDLKLREAMQIELKRIQREVGITFVFVTHDQGEALTMSDRIAVMSEGRVEQVGAPFDIYSRPESLFVAGFIGSANLLPGTIASSDGGSTRVDLAGGAQLVVPAGNSADNVSLSVGTQVTVMIRPEQLSLGAAAGLSIDVTDTVFQGATLRLVGRMVNGTEVSAVLPVDPQRVTPAPGDSVTLSWHQSAPYLLDGWPDNAGSTTTNVDSIEAAL